MTEPTQDITLAQAIILLTRYGFEMKGFSPEELIDKWLKEYSARWIRTAIIEALYQGRYKAISVEQILKLWQRRKQITCHFTHEFERLICRSRDNVPSNNLPYLIPPALESSQEISNSPKMAERKIQRKLFNPPLINQEPTGLESETQHPEDPPNQPLTALKENAEIKLTEANNSSVYDDEHLSVITVAQPHLTDSSEEDNHGFTRETLINSHKLKATLTNLDELFSQFFADSDPQKSGSSVFYTNLEQTYQWRELIPGRTIDEFTPQLDSSELYSKLKAVVRQELET